MMQTNGKRFVNSLHLDAELHWIALEAASEGDRRLRKGGATPSIKQIAGTYCPVVAETVAERLTPEGLSDGLKRCYMLSPAEATDIGTSALAHFDQGQTLGFEARVELVAQVVAAAATVRAISPNFREEAPAAGYWPFASEGGFCNPIKLKMMDD